MKRLSYSLLALILVMLSTAFNVVDNPSIYVNDVGDRWSVDTLSLSRRHTEAMISVAIRHDTLRAEKLWREILRERDDYAPALYQLSRLRSVDKAEAMDFAQRAFNVDSTNKWYGENYATMLMRNNLMDRALPVYKRILALDGRQHSTYYFIAYIYAAQKKPYQAIAILDSADVRIGRNVYLARLKRQLLIDTKQYDLAIGTAKRVVAESPYDVEAYVELARTYDLARCDSLARSTYDVAFKLDSTRLETIIELLDYHVRNNNINERFRFEELLLKSEQVPIEAKIGRIEDITLDQRFYAENFFRIGGLISTLSMHYPTERTIIHLYTNHLCRGGMFDDAMNYLRRHLDDEGVTVEDFELIASLDYTLKRDDLLKEDLERGVKLFSKSVNLWTMYAAYKYQQGLTRESIAVMRKALKLTENDEDRSLCLGRIGDFYHDLDNDAKAFKYYREALSYDPENAEVLNNYAYYLSLKDLDLEKALAMAQLAITLEENNYNYIDTYAWVLHRLGRNDEAKKYMRQALTMSSQRESSLLAHYGDILWALGEKFMAETYWKKAVDEGYDAQEMEAHIAELKAK